jgi:hypothetical protein
LLIITLAVLLAIALIVPAAALYAADSGVKGEVLIEPDGATYGFSGHIKRLSNGTVTGQWQWKIFAFSGYAAKFTSEKLTNLSFPNDKTASFNGSFTSNDLSLITYQKPVSCELRFVIAPIGTKANPAGLPVGLPPGITLPPGLKAGNCILLVYCSEGQLIATQQGNYQVNVY